MLSDCLCSLIITLQTSTRERGYLWAIHLTTPLWKCELSNPHQPNFLRQIFLLRGRGTLCLKVQYVYPSVFKLLMLKNGWISTFYHTVGWVCWEQWKLIVSRIQYSRDEMFWKTGRWNPVKFLFYLLPAFCVGWTVTLHAFWEVNVESPTASHNKG